MTLAYAVQAALWLAGFAGAGLAPRRLINRGEHR